MNEEHITLLASCIWGIPLIVINMTFVPKPYSYLLVIPIGVFSYLITKKLME